MNNYDISVPAFLRGFKLVLTWLDKAEAFAGSPSAANDLVSARLAPDMLNFAGQIQRASDAAKGCGARLTGVAAPSFADEETTFAELRERIAKTVAFLGTLTPQQFEAHAGAEVVLKLPQGSLTFTTQEYLLQFALPNFYFHLTTAYDLLRHNGVPLGKMDYLGVLDRVVG